LRNLSNVEIMFTFTILFKLIAKNYYKLVPEFNPDYSVSWNLPCRENTDNNGHVENPVHWPTIDILITVLGDYLICPHSQYFCKQVYTFKHCSHSNHFTNRNGYRITVHIATLKHCSHSNQFRMGTVTVQWLLETMGFPRGIFFILQ
jgi:hypothetical protein